MVSKIQSIKNETVVKKSLSICSEHPESLGIPPTKVPIIIALDP